MTQLGALRGIATLVVVFSHTVAYCALALTWWANRFGGPVPDWSWLGTGNWFVLTGLRQFSLFSIPVFLFASGFYLAYASGGDSATTDWKVVRTRLDLLLRPFGIWVALASIVALAMSQLTHSGVSVQQVVYQEATIRSFILILAELFLLSPFLARMAFKRPLLLLTCWVLLDVALRALDYRKPFGVSTPKPVDELLGMVPWSWLAAWGWGSFFGLGLVVNRYYSRIRPILTRLRWPLAGVALTLGFGSMGEGYLFSRIDETYAIWAPTWALSSYLYAAAATFALLAWDWRRLGRWLSRLGTHTYAVYIVHYIVVDSVAKLTYHVAPQMLQHVWLFLPVLTAAGIAGPLLLIWLTSRSPFRKYQRLLFGSSMRARRLPTLNREPAVGVPVLLSPSRSVGSYTSAAQHITPH